MTTKKSVFSGMGVYTISLLFLLVVVQQDSSIVFYIGDVGVTLTHIISVIGSIVLVIIGYWLSHRNKKGRITEIITHRPSQFRTDGLPPLTFKVYVKNADVIVSNVTLKTYKHRLARGRGVSDLAFHYTKPTEPLNKDKWNDIPVRMVMLYKPKYMRIFITYNNGKTAHSKIIPASDIDGCDGVLQ